MQEFDLVKVVQARTKAWTISRGLDKSATPEEVLMNRDIVPFFVEAQERLPSSTFERGVQAMDALFGTTVKTRLAMRKSLDNGDRSPYLPFTMIVPVANTNDHNYELNVPCLVVNSSRAMRLKADGGLSRGNNLPQTLIEVRPASDEEVEGFFTAMKERFLGHLLEETIS